ncbi:MAG: hypothetical protein HY816_02635 [Candidatus Wallbacteria bacterium]|nr:hypothetical protein [Candidatus Wallbacteria bacterium]
MVSAIALATMLLLALMGMVVHMLGRQTYSELMRIDGFLRAVAVGEACHARLLARLESVPWEQRWFRGDSDAGSDDWKDGTYDYLLADGPGPFEADLLVRSVALRSRVVLFWRLRADPFTLSPYRQIQTLFYMHADPDTPVSLGGLQTLRQQVESALAEREANREWAEEMERRAAPVDDVARLATLLGIAADPPIPDFIPPAQRGRPPSPLAARSGPSATPALPAIPSFPAPAGTPNPPAQPPNVQQLAGTRERIRSRRVALGTRLNELNARLGFAAFDPANPQDSSEFTRLAYESKRQLAACAAAAASLGPDPGLDCSPGRLDKLNACWTAVDAAHMTFRPEAQAIMNEMFVALGRYEELERDMDAAAEPPGPSASQAEALERRAADIDARAEELTRMSKDLEARMTNTFRAAGCYDLGLPTAAPQK